MGHERARRKRTPSVLELESREVLSGGIAASAAAEIRALASFVPLIKGTINGTVTSVTRVSATTDVVTYTAHGKANIIGDGNGSGQHTIMRKPVKGHPTSDTWSNGNASVTGTTDTVAFNYSGTGHTNANGSFTASLHGRATSVAGLHTGLSGSFTAQIAGNVNSNTFTITFSVKV